MPTLALTYNHVGAPGHGGLPWRARLRAAARAPGSGPPPRRHREVKPERPCESPCLVRAGPPPIPAWDASDASAATPDWTGIGPTESGYPR